jgi:hypothetical protein
VEILLNWCHIFMDTALIAYRTKKNNFHNFLALNRFMMFKNAFYFWEATSLTVGRLMPQYIAHLELDRLGVTLLPLRLINIIDSDLLNLTRYSMSRFSFGPWIDESGRLAPVTMMKMSSSWLCR